MLKFEWDERKAESNARNRGVNFKEATTVFGDPLAATFADHDNSVGEFRAVTFGMG